MKKRLDKIVFEKYPELSRTDIKKLIESHAVFIFNRGLCAGSGADKTQNADYVEVDNPAKRVEDDAEIKVDAEKLAEIKGLKEINLEPDESVKFDVIYEDDDIAIIEKPAGLVVHPSHSHKSGTLANGLLARWPQIVGVGDDPARPGIVHRLDKDVSGVMAVAKSQKGFQTLKKQFQSRTAKKTYVALIYGKPPAESGVITGAITRSKSEPTKQMISSDGKEAVTEYRVVSDTMFADTFVETRHGASLQTCRSLVEARPLTGRMHQIRLHLASIGCPIVGDKKYLPKNLLKIDNANRIMLHAKSLEIEMMDGKRRKFESPMSLRGIFL